MHAGLLLTYLGLYLMNGHGQPALLYLVPCTLGTYRILYLFQIHNVGKDINALLIFIIKKIAYHVHDLYISIFGVITGTCIILGLVRGELKELWNYNNSANEYKQTPGGEEQA